MMTVEEKCRLYELAEEAEKRGDLTEADRILQSIPLTINVARIAKNVLGKEYIENSSLNFSEAEEAYGRDWFNK